MKISENVDEHFANGFLFFSTGSDKNWVVISTKS